MYYLFGAIIIALIFFIIGKMSTGLTPAQEVARSNVISAYGVDGAMIFNAIMVLSGTSKENREYISNEIVDSFREDQAKGKFKVGQILASLMKHHSENPREITAMKGVVIKNLVDYQIIKKYFSESNREN
ncbi:MAG: hypothetical protein Fur0010_14930 [Bdellovibrio sp.]